MNKKSKFITGGILGLIIIGLITIGIFFIINKQSDNEERWNDPEWVFNLDIPEEFNESELERARGKIANARDLYDKKREDNWTWLVIGNMYEFVREYDRALDAYKQAVELNPYDSVSMLNIADIYDREYADYIQAVEYYRLALAVNQARPEYYIDLAKMYYQKMDRPDEAEKVFFEGLKNTNNHPDILTSLIKFYELRGEEEKRITYIKRLLEWYPNDPHYQAAYDDLIESAESN